jgi:hypothetical protein
LAIRLAAIDFLFQVLGCLLQRLLGAAECFDRVAKHTLGRLLDTLVKPIDTLSRHFLGSLCFPWEAGIKQFACPPECFLQPVMLRVTERIVELSGEERFS